MASDQSKSFYWDSCVFLAWLNDEAERAEVIQQLWDQLQKDGGRVYTSSLAMAEVAHIKEEKEQHHLRQDAESILDELWNDSKIRIVEVHRHLVGEARLLMRKATGQGWSLKPYDAVHLATAKWLNKRLPIDEFHTYDSLQRYDFFVNIQICEPYLAQPTLLKQEPTPDSVLHRVRNSGE